VTRTKTLVLLSGGLDSTTLAAHYLDQGDDVSVVAVDYGQRHRRELQSATAVAAFYDLCFDIVDLRALGALLTGSALTDTSVAVPDGHYAESSMRATVVPNRNMIMLSAAVGIAAARGADRVATAVHAGDHHIYPDCRPHFIRAMSLTAAIATEGHTGPTFAIAAPFVHWTKAMIVQRGALTGAPLHLTWSCYKGGLEHCGVCGTCYERREAFKDAGVDDPTDYIDSVTEYAAP
jgi:7-cyano-7-deazaguanine synthase